MRTVNIYSLSNFQVYSMISSYASSFLCKNENSQRVNKSIYLFFHASLSSQCEVDRTISWKTEVHVSLAMDLNILSLDPPKHLCWEAAAPDQVSVVTKGKEVRRREPHLPFLSGETVTKQNKLWGDALGWARSPETALWLETTLGPTGAPQGRARRWRQQRGSHFPVICNSNNNACLL